MTQRVAAFRTYFSRRRADTVTVGTSLSPHCLRVCGEMYIVLSSRLHCSLQQVIVGPLWGSITCFTVIFPPFFVVSVCLLFPACIVCRICRVKMRPTRSCPPSLREGRLTNGNVSIHFLRSPPLPAVHHCRCGFSSIIIGRIY